MHAHPLPLELTPAGLASGALRGLGGPAICISSQNFAYRALHPYTSVDNDDFDEALGDMPGVDGDTAVGEGEAGRLNLKIIGKFSASVDGHEVGFGRKAQALLGYMMLTSSRLLPRTKFIGLLWSEKDDSLAKVRCVNR